jgi:deoxyadenosine/deoxycytidine kinase
VDGAVKRRYVIEGNIGSGKSTVVLELERDPEIETVLEPVDLWQSIKSGCGHSLLDIFYKDPSRFAYMFQTVVFKTRLQSLDFKQSKPIRVSERSVMTDRHVFMETLKDMGMLTEIEYNAYYAWYDWLKSKFDYIPDAIIYIRSSPETCYNRVHHRNRLSESTITLEYLTTLHEKHEQWLNHVRTSDQIPVYVVENGEDTDIHSLTEKVKRILRNKN